MPYIFGKLWHLAIIWAIRKAFLCILQGVRFLLANHTRLSPTSDNDSYKFHIYIPYDGETCQLFTTLHLLTTPVPVVHRHIKWWPRLQCFQCWLFLSNSKMRISFFFTCAEELESSRAHWVSSLPAQEKKCRNELAWEKHKKFKRCINCSEHLRCQL